MKQSSSNTSSSSAPPHDVEIKAASHSHVEGTLFSSYKEVNINMQIKEIQEFEQEKEICLEQLAHEWLNRNGCHVSILEIKRVFTSMDMNYVKERVSVCGGGRRGIVRFLGYEFIPGFFKGNTDHVMLECCVDNLLGGIGISEVSDQILESMEALINPSNNADESYSSISFGHFNLDCNFEAVAQQPPPISYGGLSSLPGFPFHHDSSFNHAIPSSVLEGGVDQSFEAAETTNFSVLSTRAARNHRQRMKVMQSKMTGSASASASRREAKKSVQCRQKVQHSTSPIKIANSNKRLKFLLQKELQKSDVSPLGRMVLPKREAEAHLPALSAKEGMIIEMEDFETSNIWHLRYRFWPNNKTRMYVLENTKEFVKIHGLEQGDCMKIYEDERGQKVIEGTKAVKASKEDVIKEDLDDIYKDIFNDDISLEGLVC